VPPVTPLTLSLPVKATAFRIIPWRCSARFEHRIARPRTRDLRWRIFFSKAAKKGAICGRAGVSWRCLDARSWLCAAGSEEGAGPIATARASERGDETSSRQAQRTDSRRSGARVSKRQDAAGNRRCLQGGSPEPCRCRNCRAQASRPHRGARRPALRHAGNGGGSKCRHLRLMAPPRLREMIRPPLTTQPSLAESSGAAGGSGTRYGCLWKIT